MNRYLTSLLFAALLPAAAFAQATPPDSEIEKILSTRVDGQHWATGIVVGLVTPQGARTIAYGMTTKGGTRKVGADTVYDIGSVTKVFTALALADMAQRREVALDDPVAKYLPKGTALPQNGNRQITLADLATHTAGLPLRPDNLAPKDPDNKYAEYSEADLYAFLAHYKPPHPIGGAYDYSNPGFGLLGIALARRAGTDYDTLIEQRILKPLGMTDTVRSATPAMKDPPGAGIFLRRRFRRSGPREALGFRKRCRGRGRLSLHRQRHDEIPSSDPRLSRDPAGTGVRRDDEDAPARRHDARHRPSRSPGTSSIRTAARSPGRTAASAASAPSSATTPRHAPVWSF